MTYRYVPKLRWMRGERVGIQKLSQPARYDVVPLFVLAPTQYVGRDATKHKPTIPAANRVSQEILSIWGTAPIYLDASYLPEPADGPHPITRIARRARSDSLTLIPATRLNAPANYQQAVNSMAQRDERGVALRVDLQGMTSAASWIGDWPHPQSETDLIVDFADDAARAFALGDSLKHAFLNLHGAGDWRSVTTIGSNMPDSFSGYAAGLHLIDRAEWKLWQHLIGAGLPYRLDYGDYATVPTNPPPAGIRWGFPINVRYTLGTRIPYLPGSRHQRLCGRRNGRAAYWTCSGNRCLSRPHAVNEQLGGHQD